MAERSKKIKAGGRKLKEKKKKNGGRELKLKKKRKKKHWWQS